MIDVSGQIKLSGHNIISRVENDDSYIIANLLSGHADILSSEEYEKLLSRSETSVHAFIEKGYLVNPEEEEIRFRLRYIDFLENRDKEEIQVFFIPTYACNFSCSYCYQSGYPSIPDILNHNVTDGFFSFLNSHFPSRNKYITLFGGEPLLTGASYQEAMGDFMKRCGDTQISLAIVTNGYHLDTYMEFMQQAPIREIQITLDGTGNVHNTRRPHKGGGPSFTKISDNLDLCLQQGYTVNLRVVIDRENLSNLPDLARFAIDKGWTTHPGFKTQLGRNYELHNCQAGNQKLYSRLELYRDIYRLIKANPEVLEFHQPAFSIMRFLSENGRLPNPLFDDCPACKSEWAFDYTGKIYPCTATVGKPGEEIGQFYPQLSLNTEAIKEWQSRDITSIEKCRNCNIQLACGGGCGALAKNQHGYLLAPDCRPVPELIGLGTSVYF
jgi:uncharacterized protein